jgi:hypothetical protein
VTVRFEYRQQNLGAYVQAQELDYKGVKGSIRASFQVIGDDYEQTAGSRRGGRSY